MENVAFQTLKQRQANKSDKTTHITVQYKKTTKSLVEEKSKLLCYQHRYETGG